MVELAIYLLALLILAMSVLRKRPGPNHQRIPLALRLERCASGLIALYIAFFLFFSVDELLSGDLLGMSHLVPAVLVACIAFLANKLPLEGGFTLIGLSIVLSIYFNLPLQRGVYVLSSAVLIVSLPLFLAGVLFLAAGFVAYHQRDKIDSEIPPKVG